MSLKAFHVVFVALATMLCFGFGAWEFNAWRAAGATGDLVMGAGATAGGLTLLVYGKYFLKKLKHISYL